LEPGPDRSIDWLRWLIYLLAGVPIVVWLFFVRDRVLRVVGVLAVTLFIQDSFMGRRYFWAFSLGPSLVVAYVGLLSHVLETRRLPPVGVYGPFWVAFLFAAAICIAGASFGTGLLMPNVKELQFSYLEGLVFFLFGIGALRNSEELRSFFHWMVPIGALMALQHFFVATTGFHFRGSAKVVQGMYYGGVLDNGNTLGSYYALAVPTTLALALASDTAYRMRVFCYASLVLMLGSLILTGCRGALLMTVVVGAMAMLGGGMRIGRLVPAAGLAAVFAFLGYKVITTFLSSSSTEVFEMMREEGLETGRWKTYLGYLTILLNRPLGVGMAPENAFPLAHEQGIRAVTAHNIYIDIAIQTGIAGSLIFTAMAASLLLRNRRAARLASDVLTRGNLNLLFLSLAGFLGVGFFEPIYTGSTKMNNLYWLLAGLSVAAVNRVFAEVREPVTLQAHAARSAPDLRSHAPSA
jgi:hypothetical protein